MGRASSNTWRWALWAVVGCGAGEGRAPTAPRSAPETGAAPAVTAPAAASAPRSAASISSAPAPTAAATPCPRYEESLARARRFARAGEAAAAIRAYDDAVLARPYDARARLERGQVRLAASAEDALRDLRAARSLTRDPALVIDALLSTADAHTRRGDAAAARLALALAAAHGSPVAREQLAGRSACTATWTTSGLEDARLVTRWSEVLAARQLVNCGDAADSAESEAHARREVCRACEPGGFVPGDACAGPAPWRIPAGYLHCSSFSLLVQPVGAGRLYVDPRGGPPLVAVPGGFLRRSGPEPEFAWNTGDLVEGRGFFNGVRWADTTLELDPPRCPVDSSADAELAMSSGCQAGPGLGLVEPARARWYDAQGRALLEVSEHAGAVSVTWSGPTARLRGAGCDETVVLQR
ncbi:MAG: hypothetical protein IT376_10975 [Polyangiaceae bacterium]|nr:hypothetical protein [Polyangiaceae bacterium]